MRGSGSWHIAAALILTLGLSACNTTDALTPRVDIGGTGSSSPITQADTDRMAGAYSEPIQSEPLASTANTSAPRNTLEAQADALNNGSTVSPSSSGPPPDWSGQNTAQQAPLSTHGADPAQPSALQTSPSPASANTIRFLPIIGAPVEAVTPLSRQLAVAARSGGLTIRPSGDNGTEHILKGYFSALSADGKVTVVYVWDVLDNAGGRLHRMQGQETLPAKGDDPWAAISPSLMQAVADKTISGYLAWKEQAPRL